jgi:glycosyltransferase involved in cell wall biosynthesis
MASGTPPIGSTAGGIPDIIIDNVNGLLFRKGDWRDLANKILLIIQDRALRNKLALNSRRIVEKVYGWYSITLRIKRYYEVLIHA